MITIGKELPDHELTAYQDDDFHQLRFSDYRGKWLILLFYPADFTFICPTELEEAADRYDEVKRVGGEIVSISTDTHYVHKAWHDSSKAIAKVRYPMAADPTRKVCEDFGTLIPEEGLSLRTTLIIDPNGILRAMDIHDNSIGRSMDEIVRKLIAARYVFEHNGEVCPASWKPGKKTLMPGPELVGKI